MFRQILLILFSSNFGLCANFDIPSGLSVFDVPIITRSFASGFLTRTPISLLGQEKYSTEISFRVNTIDTEKVSKLGNSSKDEGVRVQEFAFTKKLPFDFEFGIQSSLSMFDRDISSFGGYGRWAFRSFEWGRLSVLAHGTSANFKNVLGTNLYGGLMSVDTNFWVFGLSLGTGVLRTTSTFDPSLFMNFNSNSPEPSYTYGRMYSHQSVKLSYGWQNLSFSAQGDWLKDFFSSINVSYLF
jgi:hypothetical protein